MTIDYKKLISKQRLRNSSLKRSADIDEFYSDRSRIIYCSSFRRLLQKAQVFSLEPNASIRTRLTHSLEVSDLGRSIANKIAYKLFNQNILSQTNIHSFVAIVENSCLIHDIGNPPFGHFGETAIKDWAKNNAQNAIPKNIRWDNPTLRLLMSDFNEFDGNPQGFRTITKLHTERDQYSLNLTFATLLCALKYSRAAGEDKGNGILKKAGYFQSEKTIVEEIYNKVGLEIHHRYPLTYIMEAADDIAYCMSDIADGIEKHILTLSDFLVAFEKEWRESYSDLEIPVKMPNINDTCSFNFDISIPWSRQAMDEAVKTYITNHEAIYNGTAESLITVNSDMGKVLETIKKVSRKKLYVSFEAENIELTGYAVISGILKHYERLFALSCEDFKKIVAQDNTGFDIERRLFNRIGRRYIEAYKYAEDLIKNETDYEVKEWWLRVHLIIDHISGMTDEFALQTYQMLEGISLLRE